MQAIIVLARSRVRKITIRANTAPFDLRAGSVKIIRSVRAFLRESCHIGTMTEYKLVLDGVPAIAVEITCNDGAHSLLGFRTEAAALVWIADQEFRAANAEAVETRACVRLRGSEDCALVALYGR